MKTYDKTISQSLLKAYIDYALGKECGLLFKAKYIDKVVTTEPTEAMQLGKYFEYKATGYSHDGKPIEPVRTQKGEPTAKYKIADEQADNFLMYCDDMGIEVIAYGERIVKDNCSLLLDIRAMYKGREVVIDLKYTGKIYDKWDDNGWALEAFEYKDAHHIQPVHYNYITGLPFYYFLFSSTNATDVEFFEVIMPQPETKELHEQRLTTIRQKLAIEIETGFIARPAFKRCVACPLYGSCTERQSYPKEGAVTIMPQYNQILDEL